MSRTRTLEPRVGRRGLMFDVAVAAAAGAISASIFVSLLDSAEGDGPAPSATPIAALLAVHCLSLAARRFRPVGTLAVVLITGLMVVALGWPPVVLGITVVVAIYSVGAGAAKVPSVV